ncbi:MAG: hypothetical protein FJZ92_12795 [Chloroflexi bacterium]|nr:hypothetical protein [Chloroflexota bacterium]
MVEALIPGLPPAPPRALAIRDETVGMSGDLAAAEEAFAASLAIAETVGRRPPARARARGARVTVHSFHWRTRLDECEAVDRLARALDDPIAGMQARWVAAVQHLEDGGRGGRRRAASHLAEYAW